jgi:hypothetical protein
MNEVTHNIVTPQATSTCQDNKIIKADEIR